MTRFKGQVIAKYIKHGGIENLGTYKTDSNGQIILENVNTGWYIITETIPAQGFGLPDDPVTRIYLSEGENAYTSNSGGSSSGDSGNSSSGDTSITPPTVTSGNDYVYNGGITNYPLNSIVIKKSDAITTELLAGATFELRKVSEDISGNSGTIIGRYTTDSSGIIVITGLEAGAYIIEEVSPPENYLLVENNSQQAWLKADGTSVVEMTFSNYPYGSLLITKVDANTNEPLLGAVFKVTRGDGTVVGTANGEFTTDHTGQILIPNLKPDTYVVTEIKAPDGYTLNSTPQTITIGKDGRTYTVSFANKPLTGIQIVKVDGLNGGTLANAELSITNADGTYLGTYTTGADGTFNVPNLAEGTYSVQETKAPSGYSLDTSIKNVEVSSIGVTTLRVANYPLNGLIIKKVDAITYEMLEGAVFELRKIDQNNTGGSGTVIARYTTDNTGLINITGLESGGYIVEEVAPPTNYLLSENSQQQIWIEANNTNVAEITFSNYPYGSLLISKIDEHTGTPLAGAVFKVTTVDGTVVGGGNGEFTTDSNGKIVISNLKPDSYIVSEIKAPDGYVIDEAAQTIVISKEGKTHELTFTNKPLSGLKVIKLDSETREPLQGAEFELRKLNGELIGTYKTDRNGTFFVAGLEDGYYQIMEVKAPDGYHIDSEPKMTLVQSHTATIVELFNKAYSGLLIEKRPNSRCRVLNY